VTPFRAKDRKVWKTRITLPSGETGIFSCGTDDLATARQVANAVKTLRRRRNWAPLEKVVRKIITLGRMFDAYESGTLDTLMKELNDPDLSALVDEWPTNDAYRMQVRRMIPKGERYPASRFTKRHVSEFLARLNQSPRREDEPARVMTSSTRNRYRAALSVFARWLVEREVLETNPVRDVRQYTPNPARMTWLTREQAKKLLKALPAENRAMEALMASTGMELQSVQRLRRTDVSLELKSARAHGSKTAWRNRVVVATEPWAWEMVASFLAGHLPETPCFTVRGDTLLKVHQRISKEQGLPATTLHDWRHSYAVWSLKDRLKPEVVARQLGHKDTSLLEKVYGRYIPDPDDYLPPTSTHSATRANKTEKPKRRKNA
jgi:integrase